MEIQRRMGGPFVALSFEVIDLMDSVSDKAALLYIRLLRHNVIEIDDSGEGQWMIGTFVSSKAEMIRVGGVSHRSFYRSLWQELIDVGLVDDVGGKTVMLPKFRKKADDFIAPAEVRAHGERLNRVEGILDSMAARDPIIKHAVLTSKRRVLSGQTEKEGQGGTKEGQGGTLLCQDGTVSSTDILINRSRREEINEEEERTREATDDSPISQKPVKGGLPWLEKLVADLWPGYGSRLRDQEAKMQICKFDHPHITEAFAAAKVDKVQRGNFDWILNRLTNPERYIEGRRAGRKRKGDADHRRKEGQDDPHLGRFVSDIFKRTHEEE